jgi:hypothetical protein
MREKRSILIDCLLVVPWRIHLGFIYTTRLLSLYNSSNRLLSLYNSTSWLQRLYLTNFIYWNSSLIYTCTLTWLCLQSWTLPWLNFFLSSVFKLNWILWSSSWLRLLELNQLELLIFILLSLDLNQVLYLGILIGSDSFRSHYSTRIDPFNLTRIQLYLLVESVLYKLDVPMYQNVSYLKPRSLIVLHVFVLPDLLTRVFTQSGNSYPISYSDAYPDFYPRLCPIPYPSRHLEPYPSRTRACYPELYPIRYPSCTEACYPDLYSSPTRTRTRSGYPNLTWALTRPGKILPDRVPGLTRGLPDKVIFDPITYPALPDFITWWGNFLLALPEALFMPTL